MRSTPTYFGCKGSKKNAHVQDFFYFFRKKRKQRRLDAFSFGRWLGISGSAVAIGFGREADMGFEEAVEERYVVKSQA